MNIKLLIDAEYVNTNSGIELLGLGMMAAFNSKSVLVHNTYQCYIKVGWMKTNFNKGISSHSCTRALLGTFLLVSQATTSEMTTDRLHVIFGQTIADPRPYIYHMTVAFASFVWVYTKEVL